MHYKVFLKRYFLSLLLFLIFRLLFVVYNFSLFKDFSFSEVILPYLWGLRFDVATASLLILPAFLIGVFRFKEVFIKWFYLLFHFGAIVFLVVDLEFFNFIGKKLTMDVFTLGGDIGDQGGQLLFHYFSLLLLGFLSMALLFYFYPKNKERKKGKFIVSLFIFILLSISVRGGLQMRSLSPKDAFIFSNFNQGNIALNPVYTLVRSIGKEKLNTVKYFSSDKEAYSYLVKPDSFSFSQKRASNVVIIILESFSYEYLKEGYMPFIESLCMKALCFDEAYANGRRSIEAMPSIFSSLPSLMDTPLYKSPYQGNKFYALPYELKKHGYETSFYHGGKKGTMGFDSYSKTIGFDFYYSMDEYPDKNDFDGNWGIFDDRYLKYFALELKNKKEPFLSSVFTLSSHQPYAIPNEFFGKFKKGSLPIHESISYVDYSLGEFFKLVEKEKFYKDTLFIITADHTQKLETKEFNNQLGRYRVPLIFFHPGFDLKKFAKEKITKQADIFPSVLDFLGIAPEYPILMGESIFKEGRGNFLFYDNGEHFYYDGNKVIPLSLEEDKKGRAYLQYFINGLIKNALYKN